MATPAPSNFTRIRRMPARGSYDRDVIYAILDAAPICHVGHVIDGRPVVIPTTHWRHGDRVYWHGSAASRMLEANAGGGEVCLTATLIDGWVLARSGFHHSVNYRSVMCFGVGQALRERDEKLEALTGFVERLFPGRWSQLRPPTEKELKATLVLWMPIEEASAKIRAAPPADDPEDTGWPVWAGVLPLALARGTPEPDAFVQPGQTPPEGW